MNNYFNKLTPYRIFYNWSNGDANVFAKDLIATNHFNRQDVDSLINCTDAIIVYWIEKFPFFIWFDNGECCLEIQNEAWREPLKNLWKLEKQLESFLNSENYQF